MQLRKALESRGDRLIHTFRGRGYAFGVNSENWQA
jgi:DNA-binding winged helix-turn-helix (wHTH) protein